MPSFTREELEALRFAARICLCESYYRYQCGKCRQMAIGEAPKALDAMGELGLIDWKAYGAPRLTEAGAKLLSAAEAEGYRITPCCSEAPHFGACFEGDRDG